MSEKKKGYTSIRIDPELWKEAKIEAIRRDMEVSELVDQALRKELGLKVMKPDEGKLNPK
jgi:predicted HicB family RNase H-like nuclease